MLLNRLKPNAVQQTRPLFVNSHCVVIRSIHVAHTHTPYHIHVEVEPAQRRIEDKASPGKVIQLVVETLAETILRRKCPDFNET
jgi:hypothetical protein